MPMTSIHCRPSIEHNRNEEPRDDLQLRVRADQRSHAVIFFAVRFFPQAEQHGEAPRATI